MDKDSFNMIWNMYMEPLISAGIITNDSMTCSSETSEHLCNIADDKYTDAEIMQLIEDNKV